MDDDEEDAGPDRATAHARLDSKRINEEEMDLDKLAKDLKKKYGHSSRSLKDLEQVPQRLLMPSVSDPNLWQIKVKVGSNAYLSHRYILNVQYRLDEREILSLVLSKKLSTSNTRRILYESSPLLSARHSLVSYTSSRAAKKPSFTP